MLLSLNINTSHLRTKQHYDIKYPKNRQSTCSRIRGTFVVNYKVTRAKHIVCHYRSNSSSFVKFAYCLCAVAKKVNICRVLSQLKQGFQQSILALKP